VFIAHETQDSKSNEVTIILFAFYTFRGVTAQPDILAISGGDCDTTMVTSSSSTSEFAP